MGTDVRFSVTLSRFVTATVLALGLAAAGEGRAGVLLDTFLPGDQAPGPDWTLNNQLGGANPSRQSLAVSFSTASAVTVESISAAISGGGDVTLGIMADSSGLPSNAFLDSTTLTDPTANVSLTGLGWALAPGDYWLVALGAEDFAGTWPGGGVAKWAFTSDLPSVVWNVVLPGQQPAPAARIIADDATQVPEPATLLLLIASSLLGVAVGRRPQG